MPASTARRPSDPSREAHGRAESGRGHLTLVSDACDDVIENIDDLVASWVTQVRKDIPEYLSISFENHVATNRDLHLRLWNQLRLLERPSDADLAATRAVGRLRAAQGVPLEALIGAYQVTHREIWDVLRAHVPATSGLLGDITTFLLARLQLVTEAVSVGYRAGQSVRGIGTLSLQRQLLEAVLGGATGADAAELAEALDLRPSAGFVGVWIRSEISAEHILPAVLRSVRGLPTAAGIVGSDVVLVAQEAEARALADRLGSLPARIGVGLTRDGLDGACASLGDARRAADSALGADGARLYEEDWLQACVQAEGERLAPLLARPLEVARRHPDLVATVRAFGACGLSISRTAKALTVHPNTASYRMDRWKALSGLDLRSGRGLASSLIVVDMVERERPAAAPVRGTAAAR